MATMQIATVEFLLPRRAGLPNIKHSGGLAGRPSPGK